MIASENVAVFAQIFSVQSLVGGPGARSDQHYRAGAANRSDSNAFLLLFTEVERFHLKVL